MTYVKEIQSNWNEKGDLWEVKNSKIEIASNLFSGFSVGRLAGCVELSVAKFF